MSVLCLQSLVISCVKTQKVATSAPAPEVTPYSQMERPAKVDGLVICLNFLFKNQFIVTELPKNMRCYLIFSIDCLCCF